MIYLVACYAFMLAWEVRIWGDNRFEFIDLMMFVLAPITAPFILGANIYFNAKT